MTATGLTMDGIPVYVTPDVATEVGPDGKRRPVLVYVCAIRTGPIALVHPSRLAEFRRWNAKRERAKAAGQPS